MANPFSCSSINSLCSTHSTPPPLPPSSTVMATFLGQRPVNIVRYKCFRQAQIAMCLPPPIKGGEEMALYKYNVKHGTKIQTICSCPNYLTKLLLKKTSAKSENTNL